MRMPKSLPVLLLSALVIAAPAALAADLGAIAGLVTDSAGAPVAHATVTAARSDGSAIRATVSGADGVYSFADVPQGSWTVTAELDGRPTTTAPALMVIAGKATRHDLVMNFGAPAGATVARVPGAPGAPSAAPAPAAPGAAPAATATAPATPAPPSAPAASPTLAQTIAQEIQKVVPEALQAPAPGPDVDTQTPFAVGYLGWMNGTSRENSPIFDTKLFTPEVRFDVNYLQDFNHPVDHTIVGSTEEFRSGEFQIEQVSFGGNFHWNNVQARFLTIAGLFAVTTPRNDASYGVGQWDLQAAYKYFSEANAGYHFDNVGHGLNIDAGIFVSYIGLFSYYNYDNWTYQPSYVSSNTPWFFNGLRIQYFPTAKLKIEPWIINGWQSYARTNSKPGLGGQILWRPKPYLSFVFNNYGMGTDVLGAPAVSRIHTDDSVEVREYNQPNKFLDMAAMSFTADAGCQYGGGQNCFNDKNGGVKTMFLGWMAYERLQFAHDHYGITLGGGQMTNPGRYLTLLPPINGADAISGSPYFTANLGDKAHMYDATTTFDYMPSQWLTFRAEMGYRHSDVPYFSGRGGITPPGGLNNAFGNTGSPGLYVCTNGLASVADTAFTPSGAGFYQSSSVTPLGDNLGPQNSGGPVDQSCSGDLPGNTAPSLNLGAGWHAWAPDLRHSQINATFAIMTRF